MQPTVLSEYILPMELPTLDSYATIPADPPITPRHQRDQARWNARRDLWRIEAPDRWSDVRNKPLCLPLEHLVLMDVDGDGQGDVWVWTPSGYSRQMDYARALALAEARLAKRGLSPDKIKSKIDAWEQSECLYLFVMAHGGNQVKWSDDERGDLDGDGLREFHDAWAIPLCG